ncbi:hypothetical protein [Actinoplanes sp. M2I2]|uniref:hypothetical protein n=1 Tax=Actinoplanes sp. M2I2 TaxID=1734444 RepID=UPI002021FACE|nr:hypothetical protein [Actinoplanes sp. M2I2]
MSEDVLWIRIVRDTGAEPSGPDEAVLARLARSPLPGPVTVEPAGRTRKVSGWSDPRLAAALRLGTPDTIMTGPGLRADRLAGDELIWSLYWRPEAGIPAGEIADLFTDLCRALDADYGRAHLVAEGTSLHDDHYSQAGRTFRADGLYWLNWFGPGELARQGGMTALRANPYAETRAYDDALFVRVGGPGDDKTAAGRQQLLDATAALPPVPPPAEPSLEPEPARIDGVNGIRDPGDLSFWVNLHVPEGKRLPAARVAGIAALAGRGDPPVSKVHVLFSTPEAARAHAAAFGALGVRVWYVDDDGRPSPA